MGNPSCDRDRDGDPDEDTDRYLDISGNIINSEDEFDMDIEDGHDEQSPDERINSEMVKKVKLNEMKCNLLIKKNFRNATTITTITTTTMI